MDVDLERKASPYQAPAFERLGTLAELTQGVATVGDPGVYAQDISFEP